jgi:hypothetical protein
VTIVGRQRDIGAFARDFDAPAGEEKAMAAQQTLVEVTKPTARSIAARELVIIFEEARNEAATEKMIEAVRALGATGSVDAAEALKEIYERTESHKDGALQHEVIRALGEVGRNAAHTHS